MPQSSGPQLCLASASPRRRELLIQLGFRVQIQAVDIDESRQLKESATAYCTRLALQKNKVAVRRFNPQLPLITADTIVVLGEKTLGKPANKQTAIDTLNYLSGRQHEVMTAVAISYKGRTVHDLQISEVRFAEINEDWLMTYVDSQEPYDKAGAYGIQGAAARWIESIKGSYSGIMGLPLFETARLLTKLDIMPVKQL